MNFLKSYLWKNDLSIAQLFGLFAFLGLGLIFLIYPLANLLILPLQFGQEPLSVFQKILANESILKSTRNTFRVAIGVLILSQMVSVPAAWLIMRTNLGANSFFKSLLSLPYAIPPFFGAVAWIFLANPTNGLLTGFFGEGSLNIYSLSGLIFVETSFLFTLPFISACNAFEQMDPSLEEAARVSGANPWQLFYKINLPLLRSSLINSSVLTLLAVFASFGVPAMIGGPGGFKVLTTEIFQLQKMGTESGLLRSVGVSSFLLILSMGSVFLIQIVFKNKQLHLISGKASKFSLIDLGYKRYFGWLFVGLVSLVFFVLPMSSLFFSALSKIQGVLSWENIGLDNYIRVLTQTEELPRALRNSLSLALGSALLASIGSLMMAIYFFYSKNRGSKLIQLMMSVPNSAPGTVISIALILSFSQSFYKIPFSIYNTLWIFIFAYVMKFLNQSFRPIYEQVQKIHPSLIEAAQMSGAGVSTSFLKIWLPLLRTSIFASLFFVFTPILSELTISILLTGPGLETLGTLIYQMQEYSDNFGGGAAVLATLTFSTIMLLNFVLKFSSRGKFGL